MFGPLVTPYGLSAAVSFFVGCDKRSKLQGGVPARAIIEVGGRPRGSQISAPAHREPCSARLSHHTAYQRKATIQSQPGRSTELQT
jgi:hypothetical protein